MNEKEVINVPEYIFQMQQVKLETDFSEVEIAIPLYSQEKGIWPILEENYHIWTQILPDGSAIIKADREGLISLARHLLTLAQKEVPPGTHIHYSNWNMLEEDSCEFIIERK